MELYNLSSRIVENQKEFLIKTTNDTNQGVIQTSLFVNGELLDANILPHAEEIPEEEVLELVKNTHSQKKSELEYLLNSFKDIAEQGNPDLMYNLGTTLLYKKMYAEARQLLSTAVSLRPKFHQAYFALSEAELALRNIDAAIEAAGQAVELKPHFADYRNNMGELCLEANSCKRAVIELEEAIKLNVYYADAYFNMALAHILNGIRHEDFSMFSDMRSKTVDLLKKAALINSDYKTAAFDEGISSLSAERLKEAYAHLRKVRAHIREKKRREKADYFNRFLVHTDWLSQTRIADRIKYLEKELNKNPGYVDLFFELGVCHLHQAKFSWQTGLDYFKQALELNPELKKAQRALDLAEEQYLKTCDTVFDIAERKSE